MSIPGEDLGWARAAILNYLESHRNGQRLSLSTNEDQRRWLEWLGVEYVEDSGGERASFTRTPIATDETLGSLWARGMLGEMVFSLLTQTLWHPDQTQPCARTKAEILVLFDPAEIEEPGWGLDLPRWSEVNHERLQELTPGEILDAALAHCREAPKGRRADLEAQILLHLEGLHSLLDVPPLLQ